MSTDRNPLSAIWAGVRDQACAAWQAWSDFWFTPQDPAPLGLLRWLTGGMAIYSHLVWGLRLEAFLGNSGWNSRELQAELQRGWWVVSFWWWVPDNWMYPVHYACLIALVLFWIGFATRITSILAFAIVVSYNYRGQLGNYGLDQIQAILLFYLMVGPSGAAFSVDRLWARYRIARDSLSRGCGFREFAVEPTWQAGLALRLIQFHYCVIYFFAGISKLQGTAWWSGEAMWLAISNYEYQSLDITFLAWYPQILEFLTHLTVLWEVTFWALVWRPQLRGLVLAIGTGMHLGIGAFLGMWTFGLAMAFGYVGYWSPSRVRSLVGMLTGRLPYQGGAVRVAADDAVAVRRFAWLKTWDFADRLELRVAGSAAQSDESPPTRVPLARVSTETVPTELRSSSTVPFSVPPLAISAVATDGGLSGIDGATVTGANASLDYDAEAIVLGDEPVPRRTPVSQGLPSAVTLPPAAFGAGDNVQWLEPVKSVADLDRPRTGRVDETAADHVRVPTDSSLLLGPGPAPARGSEPESATATAASPLVPIATTTDTTPRGPTPTASVSPIPTPLGKSLFNAIARPEASPIPVHLSHTGSPVGAARFGSVTEGTKSPAAPVANPSSLSSPIPGTLLIVNGSHSDLELLGNYFTSKGYRCWMTTNIRAAGSHFEPLPPSAIIVVASSLLDDSVEEFHMSYKAMGFPIPLIYVLTEPQRRRLGPYLAADESHIVTFPVSPRELREMLVAADAKAAAHSDKRVPL